MSFSIPRIGPNWFRNIADSAGNEAMDLALRAVAKLPGDPATRMIGNKLPGTTVTRTSHSTWTLTDRAGATYQASVTGNAVTVSGPEGSSTNPIVGLTSLPSFPRLPNIDPPRWINPIANSVISGAMRAASLVGTDALRYAAQSRYPNATVVRNGPQLWTVSNFGSQPPFQVQIRGNTVLATRNGQELAQKTVTAADLPGAIRSLFGAF